MQNAIDKLSILSHRIMGSHPNDIKKIKGEGSDRNIFRIFYSEASYIGVYGPNIEENRAFISFTKQFKKQNLPVPELFSCSPDFKFYIEEDFGDLSLSDYVGRARLANQDHQITTIYQSVLDILPIFQIEAGCSFDYSFCYQSIHFDYRAMMHDLDYFRNNFLKAFSTDVFNENVLNCEFERLAAHLVQAEARHFLYRDFQSKNIMIVDDKPHFIDYQSGRIGALQYDLASLLFDANVDLNETFRRAMFFYYMENLLNRPDINLEQLPHYYYDFALLRVLQTLAAFTFLSFKKKKTHFLQCIPQALKNIESLLQKEGIFLKLPELRRIFTQDVLQNESLFAL